MLRYATWLSHAERPTYCTPGLGTGSHQLYESPLPGEPVPTVMRPSWKSIQKRLKASAHSVAPGTCSIYGAGTSTFQPESVDGISPGHRERNGEAI